MREVLPKRCLACLVALWIFVIGSPIQATPPEQSISTSRQFIVYGTQVPIRGAICELAERTKHELLTLLGERDNWVTPIVINTQPVQANLPEAPRLAVSVGQTGFGLKLQLDVIVDTSISAPELRREILRALLIELIYRGESTVPAGTVYAAPPDWLLDGVPAAESDLPRDRVTNLLALPVAAGTILPLERFLGQRPELLDAPGRLLFRAYSFALVDLLSRGPVGPRRLARFITDLRSASNDPMADLQSHFPEVFGGSEGTEKLWATHVARLSARQPYELMSSVETERLLGEKLRLHLSDQGTPKDFALTDFPAFLDKPSARSALGSLAQDLSGLALRAHPVYAAIIAEYAQITAELAHGKKRGISRRLAALEESRAALMTRMQRIDDYLNWYEATSLPKASGAFAGYLRAAESAARPERHVRRDPISVYLDALEAQFQN